MVFGGTAGGKSPLTLVTTTVLVVLLGLAPLGIFGPRANAAESDVESSSVLATWNCTGQPCPWGDQTTSHAAVWPAAAEPSRARHGYTVSHDVYAAAQRVVGWTVTVTAGDASLFAGTPNGSHGPLASLSAGQSFTVPTLSPGVVVSLQGSGGFGYTLTPGTPPTEEPPEEPTEPGESVLATWNCTGQPCPWGDQSTGHAAVWPAAAEPTRARHGYTVSHDVYAAAQRVVGWTVTVTAGDASVFAGTQNGSHGPLASLSAGQSFTVPTLSAGVVVSLQSSDGFGYTLTPGTPPTEEPPGAH